MSDSFAASPRGLSQPFYDSKASRERELREAWDGEVRRLELQTDCREGCAQLHGLARGGARAKTVQVRRTTRLG